jgi:hypothetical protein
VLGLAGVSVSRSVLSLFLTQWRTAKKRPCRNCGQDRFFTNRGGEIRTRDLLLSSRVSGETLSRRSLRTTPCQIGALTSADGRWFMRVSGSVPLASSSQQQWALSLTLTLFLGQPRRASLSQRTARPTPGSELRPHGSSPGAVNRSL